MKIGSWKISALETGRFALDGGAMFGIVPKPLWNRTNPADEQNRIELALRVLLLRSEKRVVLVDTGIGNKLSDKEQQIYRVDHSRWTLEGSLATHGFAPSDVTDVILTHLHFDHAGGATTIRDGELVPTFPEATYHIQEKNLEWGSSPTLRDRGSYMEQDFKPLVDAGCLRTTDGPRELFEGIHLDVKNGHTMGQQMVRVTDGKSTLFFCADLFPTASHIPLPYIMGYDLQPLVTLAEKGTLLPRALEEGWILFFEHDPGTEAVRVAEGKRGIVAGENVEIG